MYRLSNGLRVSAILLALTISSDTEVLQAAEPETASLWQIEPAMIQRELLPEVERERHGRFVPVQVEASAEGHIHLTVLQNAKLFPFADGNGNFEAGIRLLDGYSMEQEDGGTYQNGAVFVPYLEVNRHLSGKNNPALFFQVATGFFGKHPNYIDGGIGLRHGWLAIKAGMFRSNRYIQPSRRDQLDDLSPKHTIGPLPVAAAYLSASISPSFRF